MSRSWVTQDGEGKFKRTRVPWSPERWDDGYVDNKGYFRVYRPDYPGAYKSGYAKRIHVVIWIFRGVIHQKTMDVHHIDHNKLNDHVDNLEVLDHGDHTREHCSLPLATVICSNPDCGKEYKIKAWRIACKRRAGQTRMFCCLRCRRKTPESKKLLSESLKRAYREGRHSGRRSPMKNTENTA